MTGKILLIEDDADLRQGLTIRLRASGYQVVAVGDGTSALVAVRNQAPDLIILDLGLPAGDGFMVMDRLKAMQKLSSIPVIVVSGRDAAVTEPRALQHGAVAFCAKPVDNDKLLGLIRRHLPVGQAEQPTAKVRRVLIVEDDADTRLGLAIRLKASGFVVLQASDGPTAVMLVAREQPNVVLLDLGLPGGDGLTVLKRLKSNPKLAAVPVIVLSARDPEVNRPKALAAGADAFLQKPADNQVLLAQIRRSMGD